MNNALKNSINVILKAALNEDKVHSDITTLSLVDSSVISCEIKFKEKNIGIFGPVLVGFAFGFGWTPCIGPILGSILALASTEENINRGIILLFSYSMGLAIPFILSGYLLQKFLVVSKNIKTKMNIIVKTGGILLLLTGLLILTNQLQALGFYLLRYMPFLQNLG